MLIIIVSTNLNPINPNSFSFILLFIIFSFSLRWILFYLFLFAWKKANLSQENRRFNASASSFGLMLFVLISASLFDFSFYKIFILFLVYGIYHLVRERYLAESVQYSKTYVYIKSVFSEVQSINGVVLLVLLSMFLLFYYNVLTISLIQPTLYYFYSTTAQVFAALLGIVVMFSILILQEEENGHEDRRAFLKRGLIGFTILYTLIIILSITGILIKDTINFNSFEKMPADLNVGMFTDLINISIFESIFLMIPVALLYLYAMISDFLKWDITIKTKVGQSVKIDSETLNQIKGAQKTKVEVE